MQTTQAKWPYVTKSAPCWICGKPDWCRISPDGAIAKCERTENSGTQDKAIQQLNDHLRSRRKGGGFHRLDANTRIIDRAASPSTLSADTPRRNDLHILAQRFKSGCSRPENLANELGLSVDALRLCELGWCDGEPMFSPKRGRMVSIYAWSFPMRVCVAGAGGAAGTAFWTKVTGLRMRSTTGAKFAFTGGSGGLFIPQGMTGGRAFLMEGATDTPAALDLGLNAFGRESSSAGVQEIIDAIRHFAINDLVIFSQRDVAHYRQDGSVYFPAQDGAAALAPVARLYCQSVRIIMPPALWPDRKVDVRDWLHAGATSHDVEQLVAAARPIQLKTQSRNEMLEGASQK